jgi:5-aminolevulinate synthase
VFPFFAVFCARSRLQQRVARMRHLLELMGIPHLDNPSHIVPAMVRDPVRCKEISNRLLGRFGVHVQPINYPTVPRGTKRLRISPSPLHSDADIDYFARALSVV